MLAAYQVDHYLTSSDFSGDERALTPISCNQLGGANRSGLS